jgi:hypothetical protein
LFGSRIITKTIEFRLDCFDQMRRIQLSTTGLDRERCDRPVTGTLMCCAMHLSVRKQPDANRGCKASAPMGDEVS